MWLWIFFPITGAAGCLRSCPRLASSVYKCTQIYIRQKLIVVTLVWVAGQGCEGVFFPRFHQFGPVALGVFVIDEGSSKVLTPEGLSAPKT